MNYSNFKLHGISPIYDQVIFVRCHLCQLIIKLPHLVEHLQKRHNIINDSNDAKLSEQITNEQLVLAQNKEKSQIGLKGSKKASRIKQTPNCSVPDSNGVKPLPKQSIGKNIKGQRAGRTAKAKPDKNNELKKEQSITNANLPLLSSILDESISDLNSIDGFINGEFSEKKELMVSKNQIGHDNIVNHNVSANSNQKFHSGASPNNNQIRFKCPVEQLKVSSNGATQSPILSQKPPDLNSRSNKNLEVFSVCAENPSKKVFNPESCVLNFQENLNGSSAIKSKNSEIRAPYKEALTSMPNALVNQTAVNCQDFFQDTYQSPTNKSTYKQDDCNFEENKFESFKFDNYDKDPLHDEKLRQMNGSNLARSNSNLSSKATKVYDPNKHCGVVVEQFDSNNGTTFVKEPCTRSLTCKKHSINLRRQVAGRCKSFNELFKEYRDEKLSTNQLVNTNKLSNNDIIMTSANVPNTLTPPTNKVPNDSKRLSTSLPFTLQNYQQNNDFTTSTSTPPGLRSLDSHEFKSEATAQANTSLNNLEPRNLIDEFDYNTYQNMPTPSYQQSHDYFINNIRLQQQQHQQPEYQQNQYHQPTLNQPFIHDHTQNTNNSMFKPFLTGLPLNPSSHPTASNFNKIPNYQPSNPTTSRPLSFDEISQQLNLNYLNKMLVKHHPRPSAVTSFNSRMTDNGGGYSLWDRRQDNLRLMLSNAFSQTENFLNKSHSFTSNLDSSTAPSNATFETKTNVKYKSSNDSVITNTVKQEQNNYKRIQSASVSEHQGLKQNKAFSPTSSKSSSKIKTNGSSKKRSTSSSVDLAQNNQAYNNSILGDTYDPTTAHFIAVKQSKSSNEIRNSLYNTGHLMSMNKQNLDHELPDKKNLNLDEFKDGFMAEDDCLNGKLGNLNNDFRSNLEQARGLNEKSRVNHQNNNFHNRFVKEESIMLNGHSINYTGENNVNKFTDEDFPRNGFNKALKYPIRAMPSSFLNQNVSIQHKPYLLEDNVGMEEVEERNLQLQNKTSNDMFQASKFIKYSADYSKVSTSNSNESSRQALKSISLSPSPSSSSSTSNSSITANVGANKATVYNTVN